jgi:hypothetical protein
LPLAATAAEGLPALEDRLRLVLKRRRWEDPLLK